MTTYSASFDQPKAASNRLLLLASSSHFVLELCHNFLPVLYPLLIIRMGLTYTQIGLLAVAMTLPASLLQPAFGFATDRYGTMPVCAVSIAWLGLLMGLVGFSPTYLTLVILLVLASVGSAAYHPAGAVMATDTVGGRRSTAIAFFSVGGTLGAAISPLWMTAFVGWLGLNSPLTLIPLAVICGWTVYQQKGNVPLARPQAGATTATRSHGFLLGLILVVLASMARAWFYVALTTYLPTWVQSVGGSVALGGQLLAVLLFTTGAGSLLGGLLADRIGPWPVGLVSIGAMAPAVWLLLHGSPPLQVLALILIGVAMGCTYPTLLVLGQDAWPQQTGLASGLVMGIGWAPGGLGASLTGYLADHSSLTSALQWLVVPPILGVLAMVIFQVARKRR